MLPANNPTVLYVDDDRDDQELFTEILKEVYPGICCRTANDGVDALKLLSTIQPPVCMFIDVNMPRMGGLELLRILRADPVYADVPAIVLTTSSSPSDKEKARQLGASDFFIKPSSFLEFKCLVKENVCLS